MSAFQNVGGREVPKVVEANVGTLDAVISGASHIVVGNPPAGTRIVVYAFVLVSDGAGTYRFRSGAVTAKTGSMKCVDGGGVSFAGEPDAPLFACLPGQALDLERTAGTGVAGGVVAYTIETV